MVWWGDHYMLTRLGRELSQTEGAHYEGGPPVLVPCYYSLQCRLAGRCPHKARPTQGQAHYVLQWVGKGVPRRQGQGRSGHPGHPRWLMGRPAPLPVGLPSWQRQGG